MHWRNAVTNGRGRTQNETQTVPSNRMLLSPKRRREEISRSWSDPRPFQRLSVLVCDRLSLWKRAKTRICADWADPRGSFLARASLLDRDQLGARSLHLRGVIRADLPHPRREACPDPARSAGEDVPLLSSAAADRKAGHGAAPSAAATRCARGRDTVDRSTRRAAAAGGTVSAAQRPPWPVTPSASRASVQEFDVRPHRPIHPRHLRIRRVDQPVLVRRMRTAAVA